MLVAASTTSSGATLPVSMRVAQENLGTPEQVWGFTLPLGATVNMNGMAACLGCIAVFSCNLYHVPITAGRMFQFLFAGLALSIGTAGVKGAGIVTSTILLQTIGLPTVIVIPILTSIWPVLDVGNTCCNVTGDLVGTAIVASRFRVPDEQTLPGHPVGVRTSPSE
jgi:Na+/H+-dicarboxylate symporter